MEKFKGENKPTLDAVLKSITPSGPMVKTAPFCIQWIAAQTCFWLDTGNKCHGISYNSIAIASFYEIWMNRESKTRNEKQISN